MCISLIFLFFLQSIQPAMRKIEKTTVISKTKNCPDGSTVTETVTIKAKLTIGDFVRSSIFVLFFAKAKLW